MLPVWPTDCHPGLAKREPASQKGRPLDLTPAGGGLKRRALEGGRQMGEKRVRG